MKSHSIVLKFDPYAVNLIALLTTLGSGKEVDGIIHNINTRTHRDGWSVVVKELICEDVDLERIVEGETVVITAQQHAEEILSAHDRTVGDTMDNKTSRILAKAKEMDIYLYGKIVDYFDTTNFDAAMTWSRSWEMKTVFPDSYVPILMSDDGVVGLIVTHATTSWPTVGQSLVVAKDVPNEDEVDQVVTKANIESYYGEANQEIAIPFDKLRDKRYAEFLAEKATIEAE